MQRLDQLLSEVIRQKSINVVMIRGGHSMGNYAGSIVGWTDSKLAIKGREQANRLFAGLYKHVDKFTGIYSSDLSRSIDTSKIALGFCNRRIIADQRLRQINFGEDEGRHFDSLAIEQKERINSLNYHAPGGESWADVNNRVLSFYADLKEGTYLVFSHGGLICTQTYNLGIQDVISNASAVCMTLNNSKKPEKLVFKWDFPEEAAEQPI